MERQIPCKRQNRPWRWPKPGWQPRWRWTWRAGRFRRGAMRIPERPTRRWQNNYFPVLFRSFFFASTLEISLQTYQLDVFRHSWMITVSEKPPLRLKIRKGLHTLSKIMKDNTVVLLCTDAMRIKKWLRLNKRCFNMFIACLCVYNKRNSQQVSVRWLPVGRVRLPCCWWPTEAPRPHCSELHTAEWSHHSVV